jgi:hypothetical protein
VPKKATPAKRQPLYRKPPPKPPRGADSLSARTNAPNSRAENPQSHPSPGGYGGQAEFRHPHFIAPSHFTLREDGSIVVADILPAVEPGFQPGGKAMDNSQGSENIVVAHSKPTPEPGGRMPPSTSGRMPDATPPRLAFSSDTPFIRLYHGNSLELLDAIYDKYKDAGRFDAIFADPPYFLSNGGITCHAGKMVKVDKGDWDVSRGPELNHEFNVEWLRRCQRVLKPNGTIWRN